VKTDENIEMNLHSFQCFRLFSRISLFFTDIKKAGLGRALHSSGCRGFNPLLGYVWVVFWTIEEYHTHVYFMCPIYYLFMLLFYNIDAI